MVVLTSCRLDSAQLFRGDAPHSDSRVSKAPRYETRIICEVHGSQALQTVGATQLVLRSSKTQ